MLDAANIARFSRWMPSSESRTLRAVDCLEQPCNPLDCDAGTVRLGGTSMFDWLRGSGAWRSLPSLPTARAEHTATLLADGRILVVGGWTGSYGSSTVLRSAGILGCDGSRWCDVAPMASARAGHSATLLSDGRVLVIGGHDGRRDLATAELFDPSSGRWCLAGALDQGRAFHAAVRHAHGVFVLGGQRYGFGVRTKQAVRRTIERWRSDGHFEQAGMLVLARTRFEVHLADGIGFVVGGSDDVDVGYREAPDAIRSAEIWSPEDAGRCAAIELGEARVGSSSASLPSGEVLVAGGASRTGGGSLRSCELLSERGARRASALRWARQQLRLVSLGPLGVVALGGWDAHTRRSVGATELWDLDRQLWRKCAVMDAPRAAVEALPLGPDRVIAIGGLAQDRGPMRASDAVEVFSLSARRSTRSRG